MFCRDGKVSSRHLLLRHQDEDGFVVMTDKRSKKVKELVSQCCREIINLIKVIHLKYNKIRSSLNN